MYNNIQTWERSEQVNDDAIDNQQLPVQRTRPAMVEQSTTNDWNAVRQL